MLVQRLQKNIDNKHDIKIQASSESGLIQVFTAAAHLPFRIQVWNATGQILYAQDHAQSFYLPEKPGVYLIAVETKQGKVTKKVMRY